MQACDLPRVLEIEVLGHAFPWTEGIFRDCLRVGYCARVIEVEDTVLGFGVMSFGAGEAHIVNLCTHPQFRRQGLARLLLVQLISEARILGAETLFLEVRPSNQAALALYQTIGFNEIGRRVDYYPAPKGQREDAIVLARYIGGNGA